ncbi:hypothetical protein [Hahella ganghwensis]|uniref:hypothetical protein n=1 Tax=Hahella ganghwensis TaxID=286420 RepID=UPI00036AAFF2|nr:hypothetical protein [Hahella ganghwensis]
MQHFSFLTLAFIGFGFSVISTMFIQRDHGEQAQYDFSVPHVELQQQTTQYMDPTCASSDTCLRQIVGKPMLMHDYFLLDDTSAGITIFK